MPQTEVEVDALAETGPEQPFVTQISEIETRLGSGNEFKQQPGTRGVETALRIGILEEEISQLQLNKPAQNKTIELILWEEQMGGTRDALRETFKSHKLTLADAGKNYGSAFSETSAVIRSAREQNINPLKLQDKWRQTKSSQII